MNNYINLKKSNVLKIGIKDSDGNDTGEHLEFDLEDIELPFKLQECEYRHRKNMEFLRNRLIIINKRQDKTGKKLLSANEEEKMKVIKEFCEREIEAWDLFLGEGGSLKLLNGRKPYYSMYEDFEEILNPIMPLIQKRGISIIDTIKKKYSMEEEKTIE